MRTPSIPLISVSLVAMLLTPRVTEGAEGTARSRGPDAVLAVLGTIREGLLSSRYAHVTRVDPTRGRYDFDCSGMTAWVLARAAPRAHRSVVARSSNGRPLARDYVQSIVRAPDARPRDGWLRVARVVDTRPGDVIAWIRPREVRSQNTGHVAFVVSDPVRMDGVPGAYLLRIADASSYRHQDDTREASGRTGFGEGTILVVADPEDGAPRAYGWFGARSSWVLETTMAIGRPVR